MAHSKQILVISDASHGGGAGDVAHVIDALKTRGFTVTSHIMDGPHLSGITRKAPAAILLYFPKATQLPLARLAEKFKSLYGNIFVPIIAATHSLSHDLAAAVQSSMLAPVHPAQVATRVQSFIRLRDMQNEFIARQDTMTAHFDIAPQDIELQSDSPLRVLFIGKAAPQFMVIINALQDRRVKVIAAFTSFTAFDYLHEENFDAVVINGLASEEPAFTISSTMRRNSRLFHVPVVLLSDAMDPAVLAQAHEKGISDIIIADAAAEEISSRVLELARYHNAHSQLKAAFGRLGNSDVLDLQTGLFTSQFFNMHSQRLSMDANKNGTPLTLAMLNIKLSGEAKADAETFKSACAQMGGMIKNLIRMQDSAAWLGDGNFAVLCPSETQTQVRKIAARISEILEGTAFDAPSGTFTVTVTHTLAVINPQEPMDVDLPPEARDVLDEQFERANNAL